MSILFQNLYKSNDFCNFEHFDMRLQTMHLMVPEILIPKKFMLLSKIGVKQLEQ